jgi:kumamolisin
MPPHILKGSERMKMPGAKATGKADPAQRLEVSVLLRRRNADAFRQRVAEIDSGKGSPTPLSRKAFEQQFGADRADIDAVRQFATAHGLALGQIHVGRCTVMLSGTVAQFNAAFGVDLQHFEHADGHYRGRVGAIHLPEPLQDCVEAVVGLDDRPIAKPHFRLRRPVGAQSARAGSSSATSYTPLQIASLYDFPPGSGQGVCVAIIELGGGERAADLEAYFAGLGLGSRAKVTVVSVDHGKSQPTGDPNGPDGEVMLDIEVIGAIAPAAQIAVYFAPNTDAGFLDAITTAIHDTKHQPSVISISWGGPESGWTQQSLNAFDQAFQAAAILGITVCVASGDNGSSDGAAGAANHVDFPASSPHALACGGTSLTVAANGVIHEIVWNDGAGQGASGGGVSAIFALPAWQNGLTARLTAGGSRPLTMRGVPDVSGDADPETGYEVRIDGDNTVIGGTSAVAPLWAGLIARINQTAGRSVGFINRALYATPSVLNEIAQGNNGAFAAGPGWDPCTGLGSPKGKLIAQLLGGA